MGGRGSNQRLSSSVSSFGSRFSFLMLSMLAAMAALYVAGRLWQDAESRVYLINELDRRTGLGKSSVSVDDTLKIISCREKQKTLTALHVELEKARQEGFVPKHLSENSGTNAKKKLLAVIGIVTTFGRKSNRDAIRKAWMPIGAALKILEEEKGIVIRFVLGRSSNHGDSSEREIDDENRQTGDFIILDNYVESLDEKANKTKLFLIHAVEQWNAEFYAKINDDVYLDIDALGAVLATHLDKPRVYIGCMKSGEVFSLPKHKWYEPDWWKFGDGKSYFQHASGEVVAISQALARFISINHLILHSYAHDDITIGSWFIGLDVSYVDEGKFCCSSRSSGFTMASLNSIFITLFFVGLLMSIQFFITSKNNFITIFITIEYRNKLYFQILKPRKLLKLENSPENTLSETKPNQTVKTFPNSVIDNIFQIAKSNTKMSPRLYASVVVFW